MKKTSALSYAQALITAAEGTTGATQERLISAFISLIKRNNDWSRRYDIVAAASRQLRKKAGKTSIVVESARTLTPAQLKRIRDQFPDAEIEERVNPELIAGVRFIADESRQLDESLRHLLKHIFSAA